MAPFQGLWAWANCLNHDLHDLRIGRIFFVLALIQKNHVPLQVLTRAKIFNSLNLKNNKDEM